jgi:hypothetical protein
VPLDTHRSPGEQSRDSLQAAWHLVNAHTSGELQSLLIEQALDRLAPEELLQLKTAAGATAMITNAKQAPRRGGVFANPFAMLASRVPALLVCIRVAVRFVLVLR